MSRCNFCARRSAAVPPPPTTPPPPSVPPPPFAIIREAALPGGVQANIRGFVFSRAVRNWRFFTRRVWRIWALRRIWAGLGRHLQMYTGVASSGDRRIACQRPHLA